jgi:hypothetical protein
MNKTGKAAFASFLSKTDRLISPGTIAKVIEAVVQRLSFPRMNFFQLSEDLFLPKSFLPNGVFSWRPAGRSRDLVARLLLRLRHGGIAGDC